MIRLLKKTLLRTARASGFTSLILNSRWRAERLLILCYHGLSLDDEHEWNPGLYMPPELFRQRLEILRRMDCNILPLGDALDRVQSGTLPPRSVALTFDDGSHDFYEKAYPLLTEFRVPATVYLTTYYCDYNRPVFDVMCSYLLWKARSQKLEWPDVISDAKVSPDDAVRLYASKHKLSGQQKDDLLRSLAERLQIDYDALCAKRILHIMTPDEAAEVARGGVNLELHTHRHRVSVQPANLQREIDDNRSRLVAIGGGYPQHFCYPGGVFLPQFPGWLQKSGVISATTCKAGLVSRASDRMLLPRLVDVTPKSADEFSAWVSGFGSFLPRRSYPTAEGQFMDETD